MSLEERTKAHTGATEAFNRSENRPDGAAVLDSLANGLSLLRDLLYVRLHEDVERIVGNDSMLMPVSERKTEKLTKLEIDLYQIAESAEAAGRRRYLRSGADWYRRWLLAARLPEAAENRKAEERIARYIAQSPDERRLAFSNILCGVLPESRRAPLVLFRLIPLAVEIVTSVAFGDHAGTSEARQEQVLLLPAIGDCPQCRGAVLENGTECQACGNPLWKFEWLHAT